MESQDLEKAVAELGAGGVVGMPTETVYGLAARIDSLAGLNLIFSTKQRPFFDPLIVHVATIDAAKSLTSQWNEVAEALAHKFWPGPLTLVMPKSPIVSDLITSGLTTVGIRMPNHPLALQLIKLVGVPLAAPSANRFGRTSPTTAMHVEAEFGGKVLVVDGGPCSTGIESTIIGIEKVGQDFLISLLRLGVVGQKEIEACLNAANISFSWKQKVDRLQAPGQMKHHYMPAVPLVIVTQKISKTDLLDVVNKKIIELPTSVEGVELIRPEKISNLTFFELPSDPTQAARQLYSKLRMLAETPGVQLLVMQWDKELFGEIQNINAEWAPIMDRLLKAASLKI